MSDLSSNFITAITNIVDKKLKNQSYDYTIVGTITSDNNGDGSYVVTINGSTSTIYAKSDDTYSTNDVVLVRVVRGNYSNKFIDCLKPY